jgi:hypothetical protein
VALAQLEKLRANVRRETNSFRRRLAFELRRRISRKIVVIESDDWGLEMASNADAVEALRSRWGLLKLTRWSTDALETTEDLTRLYEVLQRYQPKFARPPVITANFITHNIDYTSPDDLRFIPISTGFNDGLEDVRDMYRAGMANGFISPELHGYCHYDLDKLRSYLETPAGQESFRRRFLTGEATIAGRLSMFRGELSERNSHTARGLEEAQTTFSAMFGRPANWIIPPHFILDCSVVSSLRTNQILGVQASNRLLTADGRSYAEPLFRSRRGLVWSSRNCRLDPHPHYGWNASACLKSIKVAFEGQMPAVIDFHRVNFSGRLARSYRDTSLEQLDAVLNGVSKEWPDAEFWTSGDILNECLT